MGDYNYATCSSNKFLPGYSPLLSNSQQFNCNSVPNVSACGTVNKNSVLYQTQLNCQPSNFSYNLSKSSETLSNNEGFPHSNNVVASNPFETSVTCKSVPFGNHTPTYQVTVNEIQPFNRLPPEFLKNDNQPVVPSYDSTQIRPLNPSQINVKNNFQERNISAVTKVTSSASEMHGHSGIYYSVKETLNELQFPSSTNQLVSINHQTVLRGSNVVRMPLKHLSYSEPSDNKSMKNIYEQPPFAHNPPCTIPSVPLNIIPDQVNIRPNIGYTENYSAMLQPNIPHDQTITSRPIVPYANSFSNISYRPNVRCMDSLSNPPFKGNPPPNVSPMLSPVVPKLELTNLIQKGTFPCDSYPVSASFGKDLDSVMPHLPHNHYNTIFSHSPVQARATTSQIQTVVPYHHQSGSFPSSCPTVLKQESDCGEDLLGKTLAGFLLKFHSEPLKSEGKQSISVAEFRSALKIGCTLLKTLYRYKTGLPKSLQLEEKDWNSELRKVASMKDQLSEICNMLCSPSNVQIIQQKLKRIKKKRNQKMNQRKLCLLSKAKFCQNRKELDQNIDRWLDLIKEKNLKLKREAEMKKEADCILSEVRRKIQEAKRTVEKLKVFQKLRQARKENAVQKSLFVLTNHNVNFEQKVSLLRDTMLRQLSDYEAEERALKVMLETEQEGQLEEEAQWRLKRLQQFQKKKQRSIQESLFGATVEPSQTDPLFFFYQHHNAGNSSIDNLVKIRHHWDIFLVSPESDDASTIPQQWISPVSPQNQSWELMKRD